MALYSIVVPVYNSENSLPELHERIANVFDNVIKEPFELILVDDCSADNSYRVIEALRAKDKRVNGVQLAVNHGQPKAILCGFNYVQGDYVITMDDDLQHPPEEIPKLIEKMNSADDIDVVIGEYDSKKHNAVKRMGTKLMNAMSNAVYHKSNNLKITSFRLMKRYVVDNLNKISVSRPMIGPLLLQTNKRMVNVTVTHAPRVYGKSGYSFGKLVKEFDIEPSKLRLEITETVMMNNSEERMKILSGFRAAGFIVEMDDFGSGYSSLNMLKDMPVDVIKIDMKFLNRTQNDSRAKTIMQNIMQLSDDLGLISLTEGVETQEQFEMLTNMRCKMFQGYYFNKPMPVGDFEKNCMS